MKLLRKIICILLIFMLFPLSPANFFEAKAVEEEYPTFFYTYKDYESQEIGEFPHGLGQKAWVTPLTEEGACVESVPNNDGTPNKAAVFKGKDNRNSDILKFVMQYRPARENFVLSFRTRVNDTKLKRRLAIRYNSVDARAANYGDVGYSKDFVTINENLTIADTVVKTDIQPDTWYDIDILVKMPGYADIYVDGELVKKGAGVVKLENVINFELVRPNVTGSNWCIDDVKLYIADEIIADDVLQADWDTYRANEWAPEESVEFGRLHAYDQFAYLTTYNKFVMCVEAKRFYKDNKFYSMPVALTEENGVLLVPVRSFAESFGATVNYENGNIIVTHGNSTIKLIPGSDTYYIDGHPSKLYSPISIIDGNAIVQLDVLTNFFGVLYERYDDIISFSGPLKVPYTDLGGIPLTYYKNVTNAVMTKIHHNLMFDSPSPEEVMEDFKAMGHQGKHPYIRYTDFDEVKANMQKEEAYAKIVKSRIKEADDIISQTMIDPVTGETVPYVVQYTLRDGMRGTFPQKMRDIGHACSFAYKMTGDTKYKDYLWLQIQAIYDNFPDFNHHTHSLDLGNTSYGIYTAYDWLYDDWTDEQREILEQIIYEKILIPGITAFRLPNHCQWTMWTYSDENQTVITNGGIMACALAVINKYPELATQIISETIHSVRASFTTFAPDGAWEEGTGYWNYTVDSLPFVIKSMETALGDDYDLLDAPGFDKTAYFVGGMLGAGMTFPFGDDYKTSWSHSFLMFHARHFNDMPLAAYYKEKADGLIDLENWVWDAEIADSGFTLNDMPKDNYWRVWENVTMRTGWANGDTAAVLHAGPVSASHSHQDVGSFQFDMLGVRWAGDLPQEDYNLLQYGSYDASKPAQNPPPSYRYYRGKGEGHNTVIANLNNERDMVSTAVAPIIKKQFTESGSYAITDMTQTNELYDCAIRGLKLNKATGDLVVQDHFTANTKTSFFWSMHTQADIDISEDGRSAILTELVRRNGQLVKGEKRIWMGIISDDDHQLTKMKAEPLKGYYDIPPLQTANDETSYKGDCTSPWFKLMIQAHDTDTFKVAVAFAPLMGEATEPLSIPEYIPLEQWSLPEDESLAQADNVFINGTPLASFESDVYTYDISVLTEKDPIPEIEVLSDEYDVEIVKCNKTPGVTAALLKKDDVVMGQYLYVITPLNDTTKFLNDKQIPIVGYDATSEPEPGNGVVNLFDGNPNTKYATNEDGGAVTIDFGSEQNIHDVKMSFAMGHQRHEFFSIEYSVDGVNFTECYKGQSSGTTIDHESYIIDKTARYIRVKFYGNSQGSNWVSVTELCAFTK